MNQRSLKLAALALLGIFVAISAGCADDKYTERQWTATGFIPNNPAVTIFLTTAGSHVVRGEFVVADKDMDPSLEGKLIPISDIHQFNLGDSLTFSAKLNGTDRQSYLLEFPVAFPPPVHSIEGLLKDQDQSTADIEIIFRDDRELRKDKKPVKKPPRG